MTISDMMATDARSCGCEEVCSLPTVELRDRIAMIRREILPHATGREALADGVALDFDHSDAMHRKLEDLVAFESECCSDLEWKLRRRPKGDLRLTVRGLAPDSDFFEVLGAGADTPRSDRLARLAQAAGFGSAVGLLLCCVAPIAVTAVAGATVAGPIARLDNPWTIAIASVAAAIPAWLWLKRHGARCAVGGCSNDCRGQSAT